VANWLQKNLAPKGVGVVIEAEHLCMSMRVKAGGSKTITSAVHGVLREDARSRQEFFALTRSA
jgi:GTP cyclohydrolase I